MVRAGAIPSAALTGARLRVADFFSLLPLSVLGVLGVLGFLVFGLDSTSSSLASYLLSSDDFAFEGEILVFFGVTAPSDTDTRFFDPFLGVCGTTWAAF